MSSRATPIWFVTNASWPRVQAQLPAQAVAFAAANGFEPSAGRHLLLPGPDGGLAGVLFGLEAETAKFSDPLLPGKLATLLPKAEYRLANAPHGAGKGLECASLHGG